MTENNKELKAAFEKWYLTQGQPKSEAFQEIKKSIMQKAFEAAYNLRHNEAPTGEIGELIERIDDTLKYSEIWYKKAEGGLIPVPAGAIAINIRLFNSCKAHLQQAQKMSEALVNIRNDINNLKPETITRIIKQALNNKE